MSKLFKIIALLEGLSLLLLLFIAMPMKYFFNQPELVSSVGMAHGVLFIAYIVLATVLMMDKKWDMKTYAYICLASVVPFGTFIVEKKYLKEA